ncbi:Uncharacterised protein [Mycobacteroides abscessus subsp. abscessus]|nr:Uncharacterised protein [Mycobacteroides abscessus subsp. abscessus]
MSTINVPKLQLQIVEVRALFRHSRRHPATFGSGNCRDITFQLRRNRHGVRANSGVGHLHHIGDAAFSVGQCDRPPLGFICIQQLCVCPSL